MTVCLIYRGVFARFSAYFVRGIFSKAGIKAAFSSGVSIHSTSKEIKMEVSKDALYWSSFLQLNLKNFTLPFKCVCNYENPLLQVFA